MAKRKKMLVSTRAPEKLSKKKTKNATKLLLEKIAALQKIFYASGQRSLLIVVQGIDASGKDGLISKLSTGMNPMGCTVHSFKAPTREELGHDFLWRVHAVTPAKGMIQIFNRSHYEDVLVTRVESIIDTKTAKKRFAHINHFEQLLMENGTTILKFYLHVSKERQAERLNERAADPKKNWKQNDDDWKTNQKYEAYQEVYEDVLQHCNQPKWTIVPSDQNWYKEYIVIKQVYAALKGMKLSYPLKQSTEK